MLATGHRNRRSRSKKAIAESVLAAAAHAADVMVGVAPMPKRNQQAYVDLGRLAVQRTGPFWYSRCKSSPCYVTLAQQLILNRIAPFFANADNLSQFKRMRETGPGGVSLRVVDHFYTNWCKTHCTLSEHEAGVLVEVKCDYDAMLSKYNKPNFDPFSRGQKCVLFETPDEVLFMDDGVPKLPRAQKPGRDGDAAIRSAGRDDAVRARESHGVADFCGRGFGEFVCAEGRAGSEGMAESESNAECDSERDSGAGSESKAERDSECDSECDSGAESGAGSESKAERDSECDSRAGSESKADDADSGSETKGKGDAADKPEVDAGRDVRKFNATTVGQLHFFHWLLQNKQYLMIHERCAVIHRTMSSSILRNRREKHRDGHAKRRALSNEPQVSHVVSGSVQVRFS